MTSSSSGLQSLLEASGSNCLQESKECQPQHATANDTIVNMIWSDTRTRLVSSLQPELLLGGGPKSHLGMTTHSDLWRTPPDDLPLRVIPVLRIWEGARAEVSQSIVDAVSGRITALRKSAAVSGIVAWGSVPSVGLTQHNCQTVPKEVEAATALFQYALSTRAGCECVAHVIQGLCEMNPTATITSIDGLSAYDSTSRPCSKAFLTLMREAECCRLRLFYGIPSSSLWENDSGTVHRIREQEDVLMPRTGA